MLIESSGFVFVVCQVGSEPALKKELKREHPELKFAFSRPGFVTFKSESPLPPEFHLRSVFARAYGLSLFKLGAKAGGLQEKAQKVFEWAESLAAGDLRPNLHIFERDRYAPSDEPLGYVEGEWKVNAVQAIEAEALKRKSRVQFKINSKAAEQERVIDLIVVEPDEWWIGVHDQGVPHNPYPGGNPEILLHPDAPSRAYIKLEEAILWSGVPIRPGDTAVEVGSAPGGASFALLKRGLNVVGIDPGEMDPRVLRSKQFRHIQNIVANIPREELPASIEWLLLDMNVTPSVSLFAVDRLATRMKGSLLGLLLTVKLNQWKLADEIPAMLEHIRVMGMSRVKATQLSSNRQEIFIFGLTRKGVARPRTGFSE